MSVLFWFRKNRNPQNPGFIQCRVTINKQYVEIGTTGITCHKHEWDAERQQITAGPDKLKHNKRLRDMAAALDHLHDILLTQHTHVTPQLMKEHFTGKAKFTYTAEEIIGRYLQHRHDMVMGSLISPETFEVNQNYCRHLKDFFKHRRIKLATDVQDPVIDELFYWLLSTNRMAERTARR